MHICVDLLVNKFSPQVRGIIGFATYSFSLLACVIISWRTAVESIAVRELNSVSASFGIPLQPFYWITAFGFAVLCLEILILLIEATKGLLGK
jgi:TRAP-type C4-dicarboxylate transport system permease small subunit